MLQPYPETLDNIQIIKANPGNKWVRSPAQKNCQLMAVGLHRADQNLNAALGIQARGQQQHRAGSGTTEPLWSWPGRKQGRRDSCGQVCCAIPGPGTPMPIQLGSDRKRGHSRKELPCSTCKSSQHILGLAAF